MKPEVCGRSRLAWRTSGWTTCLSPGEKGPFCSRKPVWSWVPPSSPRTPRGLCPEPEKSLRSIDGINYLKVKKSLQLPRLNLAGCLQKVDFGPVSWWQFFLARRLDPSHSRLGLALLGNRWLCCPSSPTPQALGPQPPTWRK